VLRRSRRDRRPGERRGRVAVEAGHGHPDDEEGEHRQDADGAAENDVMTKSSSVIGKQFPAMTPIVANKADYLLVHFMNEACPAARACGKIAKAEGHGG